MTKKKNRIPISEETAAEILFLSDRTCCVCNNRGKAVQIHHIDENPSNNDIENLSVLCLECHNETMIKGGFGRKLDAQQVKKYKEEWLLRVKHRKNKADEIASVNSVVNNYSKSEDRSLNYKDKSADLLSEYLNKILAIHNTQLNFAQEKWNSGITAKMNQGNYDMVDFYEEVLVELSTFYPKGHFENKNPRDYFSEIISSKFKYHSLILEPEGVGTGGTIISTMTGGNVMADLKRMISDMVIALTWPYDIDDKINLKKWKEDWF